MLYEQEGHRSGESLSEAHKLQCVKVVTTCLRPGVVPLAKTDRFRDLLVERTYSLSNQCGKCDMIPLVHSEEQVKAELQRISVIFDGSYYPARRSTSCNSQVH